MSIRYIKHEDLVDTLASCFLELDKAPSFVTFSAVVDHTLNVLESHSFDTVNFALKLREALDTRIVLERLKV